MESRLNENNSVTDKSTIIRFTKGVYDPPKKQSVDNTKICENENSKGAIKKLLNPEHKKENQINDNKIQENTFLQTVYEDDKEEYKRCYQFKGNIEKNPPEISVNTKSAIQSNRIETISTTRTESEICKYYVGKHGTIYGIMSMCPISPEPDRIYYGGAVVLTSNREFFGLEEAKRKQRYIKEQMLKEKMLVANKEASAREANKSVDREKIKERLMELEKTTKKIIDRNIQRARKRNENSNMTVSTLPTRKKSEPKKCERCNNKENKDKVKRKSLENLNSINKMESKQLEANNKETKCTEFNSKRIGILRRNLDTDVSDVSHVHIHQNHSPLSLSKFKDEQNLEQELKSNELNSEMSIERKRSTNTCEKLLKSKLEVSEELPSKEISKRTKLNENLSIKDDKKLKNYKESVIKLDQNLSNDFDVNNLKLTEPELTLMKPELTLKRKPTLHYEEKSVQVNSSMLFQDEKKKTKLPLHWLEPCPVQIYPYNFVTAVRKKIEAITTKYSIDEDLKYNKETIKPKKYSTVSENISDSSVIKPVTSHNSQKLFINCTNIHNNSDKISNKYNSSSFSSSSTASAAIKPFLVVSKKPNDEKESLRENIDSNKATKESSSSVSELTSNFSSITVNIPQSKDHQYKNDHDIQHQEQTPTILEINSIKSDSSTLSNQNLPIRLLHNSQKIRCDNNSNDDTTISSSVFSSPEKHQRIQTSDKENNQSCELIKTNKQEKSHLHYEHLQIENKNFEKNFSNDLIVPSYNLKRKSSLVNKKDDKLNSETSSGCFDRSASHYKSSFAIENIMSTEPSHTKLNTDLNFEQFLEEFNKNLSQVIEATEQIKTSVNKTSPHKSIENSNNKIDDLESKKEIYYSDFEESTVKSSTNINDNKTDNKKETLVLPLTQVTTVETIYDSKSLSSKSISSKSSSFKKSETYSNDPQSRSESKSARTITMHQNLSDKLNNIKSINNNDCKTSVRESLNSINNNENNSIEDKSKDSTQLEETLTSTEIEIAIEEEISNKLCADAANDNDNKTFSHNDIDDQNTTIIPSTSDYFQTYINTSRGNYMKKKKNNINDEFPLIDSFGNKQNFTSSEFSILESYKIVNESLNSSIIESELHQSDEELSITSFLNNSSETTLSNFSWHQKILKTEIKRSEILLASLKFREKMLMYRTKSQIALLEAQKEKSKTKGLTVEMSAIKKRQRAILLKMEKEKEEIERLIKSQNENLTEPDKTVCKNFTPSELSENQLNISLEKYLSQINGNNIYSNSSNNRARKEFEECKTSNKSIVRGYNLDLSRSVETILKKREENLQKRRERIKLLLEWHTRLNKEEEEIHELEKMLLNCNKNENINNNETFNNHDQCEINNDNDNLENVLTPEETYKQKKLDEINKSLKELQSIPNYKKSDNSNNEEGMNSSSNDSEYVYLTGINLNKLWKKLTGRSENKFEITRTYKMNKESVEKLYEDAKNTVLDDFRSKDRIKKLLGESSLSSSSLSVIAGNVDKKDIKEKLSLSINNDNNVDDNIGKQKLKDTNNLVSELNMDFESSSQLESSVEKLTINKSITSSIIKSTIITNAPVKESNENSNGKTIEKTETGNKRNNSTDSINSFSNTLSSNKINSETETDEIFDLKDSSKLSNSSAGTSSISTGENFESIIENNTITSDIIEQISNESENCKMMNSVHSSNAINDIIQENKSEKSLEMMKSCSVNDQQRVSVIVNLSDYNNSNRIPIDLLSNQQNLNVAKPVKEEKNVIDEYSSNHEITIQNNLANLTEIQKTSSDDTNSVQKSNDISTDNLHFEYSTTSFESNVFDDDTIIGDISLPKFESTLIGDDNDNGDNEVTIMNKTIDKDDLFEESQNQIKEQEENENNHSQNILVNFSNGNSTDIIQNKSGNELEKRLIDIGISLKELHHTFERALSPEKSLNAILETQNQQHQQSLESSINELSDSEKLESSNKSKCHNGNLTKLICSSFATASTTIVTTIMTTTATSITTTTNNNNNTATNVRNYLAYPDSSSPSTGLMPDIINEVELRRRQQILFDSEMKPIEHEVPYVFLREIPNKPPPPYVPPAHGSPMTAIFPSEQRIKEITYRRIKELYEEIINENANSSKYEKTDSILNENITNIYERIILDICKERIDELKFSIINLNPNNYKYPLALYNPPDRLKCLQDLIYKDIRKILAMDKKITAINSRNHYRNKFHDIGRRKCDQIDEILMQELLDDENKWTIFDLEESEIKELLANEIFDDVLNNIINDCILYNREKRNH